jgi:hypothetical protein
MGILDKIADIEKEVSILSSAQLSSDSSFGLEQISRTQKNKATEHHLGLLKAKLAKYRAMLLEPTTKSGPKGVGFDVVRQGDASNFTFEFCFGGEIVVLDLNRSCIDRLSVR